jgi:hypothetical protein
MTSSADAVKEANKIANLAKNKQRLIVASIIEPDRSLCNASSGST